MKLSGFKIFLFFFLANLGILFSQNDSIALVLKIDEKLEIVTVNEKIFYTNKSVDPLHSVYFHDWNHAYSNKNSPLGKRLIENYSKKFFFTNEKNRGYTDIKNFTADGFSVLWFREPNTLDQIEVVLDKPLLPNQKVIFEIDYVLKLPNAKFTGYGIDKNGMNLKNAFIVPVVNDNGWQTMSNLDLDDIFLSPTHFSIDISLPDAYYVLTDLKIKQLDTNHFRLEDIQTMSFDLEIVKQNTFKNFRTESLNVLTDLNFFEISDDLKTELLNRQIKFVEEYLGTYPHSIILINKLTYEKNPLYGINQLPGFLRPFPDVFEWDIRMFQTLAKTYIDKSVFSHTRKEAWLREGLPHFLALKYVEEHYPEKKLLGRIAELWGIKSYYVSKMKYTDKYQLAQQYIERYNFDQSLTTHIDSLSNFNREVANRFKTAMGINYLGEYTGDKTVKNALNTWYKENRLNMSDTDIFRTEMIKNAKSDVNWFFDEYIATEVNPDYRLKKLRVEKDTLYVNLIKTSSNIPISLYGTKNDTITNMYWIEDTKRKLELKYHYNDEDKLMLNYENKLPEINLKNNWKNISFKSKISSLKIRLISDSEDPYHPQLFLNPKLYYNYYDGFSTAMTFQNRGMLKKSLEYKITPSYGLKSQDLSGSFSVKYWKNFENSKISSFTSGVFGNYFHYNKNLSYKSFSTFAQMYFRRDNLRKVNTKALTGFFTIIDREVDTLTTKGRESNKYSVSHIKYSYSNPELINRIHWSADIEIAKSFSKVYNEFLFRRLTYFNQQFEMRLYTGIFLYNNTKTDFFSFAVNRPSDYLFMYKYYGLSESKGIWSQQFIMNEGGFKSDMPLKFANQWITSLNTSIGLWKWFEIYTDIGFAKSRNERPYFLHDKGIRLNFVSNYLEIYFPLHSNNGWEISYPNYPQRIRFVLTTDFKEIMSFLKRGVM